MRSALVYIVTLAAGESRRFGSPKQLALLEGQTLLARAGHTVTSLKQELESLGVCAKTILVLGAHAQEIEANAVLSPWDEVVRSQRWGEGMQQSILCGLEAAMNDSSVLAGALLHLVDQPMIQHADLARMIEQGMNEDSLVCSRYPESVGVPAYFPSSEMKGFIKWKRQVNNYNPALSKTEGGAKQFIRSRPHMAMQIDGVLLDVDTPEDMKAIETAWVQNNDSI